MMNNSKDSVPESRLDSRASTSENMDCAPAVASSSTELNDNSDDFPIVYDDSDGPWDQLPVLERLSWDRIFPELNSNGDLKAPYSPISSISSYSSESPSSPHDNNGNENILQDFSNETFGDNQLSLEALNIQSATVVNNASQNNRQSDNNGDLPFEVSAHEVVEHSHKSQNSQNSVEFLFEQPRTIPLTEQSQEDSKENIIKINQNQQTNVNFNQATSRSFNESINSDPRLSQLSDCSRYSQPSKRSKRVASETLATTSTLAAPIRSLSLNSKSLNSNQSCGIVSSNLQTETSSVIPIATFQTQESTSPSNNSTFNEQGYSQIPVQQGIVFQPESCQTIEISQGNSSENSTSLLSQNQSFVSPNQFPVQVELSPNTASNVSNVPNYQLEPPSVAPLTNADPTLNTFQLSSDLNSVPPSPESILNLDSEKINRIVSESNIQVFREQPTASSLSISDLNSSLIQRLNANRAFEFGTPNENYRQYPELVTIPVQFENVSLPVEWHYFCMLNARIGEMISSPGCSLTIIKFLNRGELYAIQFGKLKAHANVKIDPKQTMRSRIRLGLSENSLIEQQGELLTKYCMDHNISHLIECDSTCTIGCFNIIQMPEYPYIISFDWFSTEQVIIYIKINVCTENMLNELLASSGCSSDNRSMNLCIETYCEDTKTVVLRSNCLVKVFEPSGGYDLPLNAVQMDAVVAASTYQQTSGAQQHRATVPHSMPRPRPPPADVQGHNQCFRNNRQPVRHHRRNNPSLYHNNVTLFPPLANTSITATSNVHLRPRSSVFNQANNIRPAYPYNMNQLFQRTMASRHSLQSYPQSNSVYESSNTNSFHKINTHISKNRQ